MANKVFDNVVDKEDLRRNSKRRQIQKIRKIHKVIDHYKRNEDSYKRCKTKSKMMLIMVTVLKIWASKVITEDLN